MNAISAPTIDRLELADDPARWAALGFAVADGECRIGDVRLRFTGARPGVGIAGWSLRDVAGPELAGVPRSISRQPPLAPAPAHPNGVFAIDHVVAVSPCLERSVDALQ